MSYVDVKLEEDTKKKILDILSEVVQGTEGKKGEVRLKKGINETTKAIERTPKPLLVVIAEDIQPPELAMHLPKIAQEQKVNYCFVSKREELGKAIGLKVNCASLALLSVPEDKKDRITQIVNWVNAVKK
jgi:large subunit ribosomal protein L7Ae